jgi:hypothetical protein
MTSSFRTAAALAALFVAGPAMACPDWKAVAMFDEMIAKHHGLLWSSSCQGVEYVSGSKIREIPKEGKPTPEVCSYYHDTAEADYDQMEQHRDAAMKDDCK